MLRPGSTHDRPGLHAYPRTLTPKAIANVWTSTPAIVQSAVRQRDNWYAAGMHHQAAAARIPDGLLDDEGTSRRHAPGSGLGLAAMIAQVELLRIEGRDAA